MRVAITGATGLIGHSVATRLVESHEVVRLGRRPGSHIPVDLSDAQSVDSLELDGCDALVHCAGVVDEDFFQDEAQAWLRSTRNMRLLVARAVDAGVRTIAYISTSHVYGPLEGRIDERTCPAPASDYAIAHFSAERILARSALSDGVRILVLRPNAVFGVPPFDTFDRWTLIPFGFPLSATQHHEIVLRSTGEQRRNFVGTGDLAAWIEAFLAGKHEGFNVINPIGKETLSVYEFALRCAAVHETLSGRRCAVMRVSPEGRQPGADFTYASVAGASLASQRVEDYLKDFMLRLMEGQRNGR